MKYCVIKDTTKQILSGVFTDEQFTNTALGAGFSKSEVEILTEEEYQARKALEPLEPQQATLEEQLEAQKSEVLTLRKRQTITDELVEYNSLQQQDLLELLLEMGII